MTTPQPSEQPRTRFYRTRVLSLLRHDSECTDGQWCVCKAGQALMDLIAAERAEAAAPDPVASPALDVERLAAALDVLSDDGQEYALMAPEDREFRYEAAQRLAAAYALEGQPVVDEPADD